MIIDVHVHPQFLDMLPGPPTQNAPRILNVVSNPENIGFALAQTSESYFKRSHVMMSLHTFIGQMDEAKIDRAVLVNPGIKGLPVRPTNEVVGEVLKKFPDRFIGFAGFDPNNGEDSVDEIEYAIKTLGFSGIKSVPSALELDINDRAFYPFYNKAEELGIPVLIHVGSVILKGLRTRHVHPLMIDDVAFDFPDLKIICAHLGGWQYMDTISMMLQHRNVYADLSFWPLNPLFKDLVPWKLLENALMDKIMFGSDYPAGQTPSEAAESVRNLPISDGFKEKILGKNASMLLGL
jgi:predicted TIM-barrel fold metal-dependent hydrolase